MHFTSKLQTPTIFLFVNETSSVGVRFLSLSVTNNLVPKLYGKFLVFDAKTRFLYIWQNLSGLTPKRDFEVILVSFEI